MISYVDVSMIINMFLLLCLYFMKPGLNLKDMILMVFTTTLIAVFVGIIIDYIEGKVEDINWEKHIKNARKEVKKGNFKNISCAGISLSEIPASNKYAWYYRNIPSKGIVYSASKEDMSQYSSGDLLEKYFGLYGSGIKVLLGLKTKNRRYWYINKNDLPKLRKYIQEEYSSFIRENISNLNLIK